MKKGISAIISTILLVTFAITLGVVFIGWSSGVVRRSVERSETKIGTELDCMNIKLKLEKVQDKDKIIIKNNNIKDALTGYIARIILEDGKVNVDNTHGNNEIKAYSAAIYDYSSHTGIIKKIEIIPRINIAEEGKEIVDCPSKAVSYTF